jgi:hypothetical protein
VEQIDGGLAGGWVQACLQTLQQSKPRGGQMLCKLCVSAERTGTLNVDRAKSLGTLGKCMLAIEESDVEVLLRLQACLEVGISCNCSLQTADTAAK